VRLISILDKELIDFIEPYAEEHQTTIFEIVRQFILNLKKAKENDPMEIILNSRDFKESLMNAISMIRSGQMRWHSYNEIF